MQKDDLVCEPHLSNLTLRQLSIGQDLNSALRAANTKGALLEVAAKYRMGQPQFYSFRHGGLDHQPTFQATCSLDGEVALGDVCNVRLGAEQSAARAWIREHVGVVRSGSDQADASPAPASALVGPLFAKYNKRATFSNTTLVYNTAQTVDFDTTTFATDSGTYSRGLVAICGRVKTAPTTNPLYLSVQVYHRLSTDPTWPGFGSQVSDTIMLNWSQELVVGSTGAFGPFFVPISGTWDIPSGSYLSMTAYTTGSLGPDSVTIDLSCAVTLQNETDAVAVLSKLRTLTPKLVPSAPALAGPLVNWVSEISVYPPGQTNQVVVSNPTSYQSWNRLSYELNLISYAPGCFMHWAIYVNPTALADVSAVSISPTYLIARGCAGNDNYKSWSYNNWRTGPITRYIALNTNQKIWFSSAMVLGGIVTVGLGSALLNLRLENESTGRGSMSSCGDVEPNPGPPKVNPTRGYNAETHDFVDLGIDAESDLHSLISNTVYDQLHSDGADTDSVGGAVILNDLLDLGHPVRRGWNAPGDRVPTRGGGPRRTVDPSRPLKHGPEAVKEMIRREQAEPADRRDVPTVEEAQAQRAQVVSRLAKKLDSHLKMSQWLCVRSPPKQMILDIYAASGLKQDLGSAWGWFVATKVGEVKHTDCLRHVFENLTLYRSFRNYATFPEWWLEQTGQEWQCDVATIGLPDQAEIGLLGAGAKKGDGPDGWGKAMAARHNKLMHSINGNMAQSGAYFNRAMRDVKAKPSGLVDISKNRAFSRMLVDPQSLAQIISTIEGNRNPNAVIAYLQAYFSAGGVNVNGSLTSKPVSVDVPTAMMAPRKVRNGAGAALINSTQRLSPVVAGVISSLGHNLIEAGLYKTLIADSVEKMLLSVNRNVSTAGGFQPLDALRIGATAAPHGLNLEQFVLKLVAYAQLYSMGTSPQYVPLAGEPQKLDSYTKWNAASPGVTLSLNDSPVFGEGLGGSTSKLPARGGSQGTINFVTCLNAVPEQLRDLAIFIPCALIATDPNPALAIALMVMGFADFPYGLFTSYVNTLDSAGGNAASQVFVPYIAQMLVPGLDDVWVVLPRNQPGDDPTTAQDALNKATYVPSSGSTPSATIPANTQLQINWVGGPAANYPLAEYLYTFFNDIDQTSIAQALYRLNQVVPILTEICYAREVCAVMSSRIPAMVADAVGSAFQYPVNNAAGFVANLSVGLTPQQLTSASGAAGDGTWPLASFGSPDFFIGETLPRSWNQVMVGLFTMEATDRPIKGQQIPSWVSHPSLSWFQKVAALPYAAATQAFWASTGLTVQALNDGYNQLGHEATMEIVRMLYIQRGVGTDVVGAPLGSNLAATMQDMFGFCPALTANGLSVWHVLAPAKANRTFVYDAINSAFLNNVRPVLLADVWLGLLLRKCVRALTSFPPPGPYDGALTGICDGTTSAQPAATGTYYFPVQRVSQTVAFVENDVLPEYTDDEEWNRRVAWHLNSAGNGVSLRYFDASAVSSTVPSGSIVVQRPVLADSVLSSSYVTYESGSIREACTTWIPWADENGKKVWPMTPTAAANAVNAVLLEMTFGAIPTWQAANVVQPPSIVTGLRGTGAKLASRFGLGGPTPALNSNSSASTPTTAGDGGQM